MTIFRLLPLIIIAIIVPSFIEVDITLPGFPQMQHHFNSSVTDIQWTLVINFIGLCLLTLIYGPLSDTYGRKTILFFGCGLFCLASIGCAITNDLTLLYLFRFLQGLGCSAIWVVGFIVASDSYNGNEVVKVFGMLSAAISTSLTIAPMMGSFIVAEYGWRATYSFVALLSFISFFTTAIMLPETNLVKKPFNVRAILLEYFNLITSIRYLVYSLIPSILVSALIVYVSAVPFLYLNQFHMSFYIFALYQAVIGGCLAIVGFYSGQLHKIFGASNCILLSVIICCVGSVLLLITSQTLPSSVEYFALSMSIICIGTSIQFSLIFAKSLEIFPNMRGAASSLITFFRLILFTVCVIIASRYYSGELYDTAKVISTIIAVGLGLSIYVFYDLKCQLGSNSDILSCQQIRN